MPRQPMKKSMRPRASLRKNGKPFPKAPARPQRKRLAKGAYNVEAREQSKVDSEALLDPKGRRGRGGKNYRALADVEDDEEGADDDDEDAEEARGGGGQRGPVGKWAKYPGAEAALWAALRKHLPSGGTTQPKWALISAEVENAVRGVKPGTFSGSACYTRHNQQRQRGVHERFDAKDEQRIKEHREIEMLCAKATGQVETPAYTSTSSSSSSSSSSSGGGNSAAASTAQSAGGGAYALTVPVNQTFVGATELVKHDEMRGPIRNHKMAADGKPPTESAAAAISHKAESSLLDLLHGLGVGDGAGAGPSSSVVALGELQLKAAQQAAEVSASSLFTRISAEWDELGDDVPAASAALAVRVRKEFVLLRQAKLLPTDFWDVLPASMAAKMPSRAPPAPALRAPAASQAAPPPGRRKTGSSSSTSSSSAPAAVFAPEPAPLPLPEPMPATSAATARALRIAASTARHKAEAEAAAAAAHKKRKREPTEAELRALIGEPEPEPEPDEELEEADPDAGFGMRRAKGSKAKGRRR